MSLTVGELNSYIGLDDSAFNAGIAAARGKFLGLAGVGKLAGVGIAGALGAAALALVKLGGTYDEATNTIRANTGLTGDALAGLEDDFKAVYSKSSAGMDVVSAAVSGLYQRLQITGKPLRDMTIQFVRLSRLTKTDVAENVRLGTRLFGDWSIASKDQAGALDLVFRATQQSGIGLQDLMQTVVEFGAPLRNMGFEFGDSVAMLAKWEKEGVNTSTVLTGMKFALKTFAKAGLDPQRALEKLIPKMRDMRDEQKAMDLGMKTFGLRAGPDMVAAIREGRFEYADFAKAIKNGHDTITQAAKDTATWKSKLTVLGHQIMNGVEPAASWLVNALTDLAAGFMALDPATRTFTLGLAAATLAAGPVIGVVGRLVPMLSALTASMQVGGVMAFGSSLAAALGPTGIVVGAIAGVAALGYGLHKLSGLFEHNVASAEDMKNTIKHIEADTTGELRKWADKALGGHLVVKAGKLTWEPDVDVKTPDTKKTALTEWVHVQAVEERKKIREEALKTREEYIRSAAQVALAAAEATQARTSRAKGDRKNKDLQREYREQMGLYRSLMDELDKMGAKRDKLQAKFKPLEIQAKIDDLKTGIRKAEGELKRLADLPKEKRTAKVLLQENKLREKVAAMRDELKGISRKNWRVLVKAEIEKEQGKLGKMRSALTDLNKQKSTPKVEADKRILEKAIATSERRLKDLNKQKASPDIGITDRATKPLVDIKQLLNSLPASKTITVTTKNVTTGKPEARGGVETLDRPTSFLAGEAGREIAAFFPLGDPSRVRQVYEQLTSRLAGVLRPPTLNVPAAATAGVNAAPTLFIDARGAFFGRGAEEAVYRMSEAGYKVVMRRGNRTRGTR
jgi:hypothetical protein